LLVFFWLLDVFLRCVIWQVFVICRGLSWRRVGTTSTRISDCSAIIFGWGLCGEFVFTLYSIHFQLCNQTLWSSSGGKGSNFFDFYCSLRELRIRRNMILSILRPDRSHRILLRASRISMKGPKATSCLFIHPNPPSASPKSASAASQRGTSNTSRYLQGQRISP
jgi:hypothetical protein